jgi:hypothetical protein
MKFDEVNQLLVEEEQEYKIEERRKMQEVIFHAYRYYTGEVIIQK